MSKKTKKVVAKDTVAKESETKKTVAKKVVAKKVVAKKTAKVSSKVLTSAQVQAILDSKITARLWENESDRFATMNEKQLESRLFKITNPVKMEAFRQLAAQNKYPKLIALATEKRDFFMEDVRA